MQTATHKEAVHLFSGDSKQGKDQTLKDFTSDTLPALKEQLDHVRQLNTQH